MGAAVRRVSNRRAFLVSVGAGWAGYGGLGTLLNPRYGTSRGLDHITEYVSMTVLGWGWVGLGTLAILAGLVTHCPRVEAAGFVALAAPAALWGTAFLTAAVTGYATAIGSACGWLGFALGVLWVSGMDDPLPPHLRKRV